MKTVSVFPANHHSLGQLLRKKLVEQEALKGKPEVPVKSLAEVFREPAGIKPDAAPSPAQIEWLLKAIRKQRIAELTAKHSLKFVYLRNYDTEGEKTRNGGMTIAYKAPRKGCSVVELSTAVCSSKDYFEKLEGKLQSAENFDKGNTVMVKLSGSNQYAERLDVMFSLR